MRSVMRYLLLLAVVLRAQLACSLTGIVRRTIGRTAVCKQSSAPFCLAETMESISTESISEDSFSLKPLESYEDILVAAKFCVNIFFGQPKSFFENMNHKKLLKMLSQNMYRRVQLTETDSMVKAISSSDGSFIGFAEVFVWSLRGDIYGQFILPPVEGGDKESQQQQKTYSSNSATASTIGVSREQEPLQLILENSSPDDNSALEEALITSQQQVLHRPAKIEPNGCIYLPKIANLAVLETSRRLGVGRQLVDSCVSRARLWGFDQVLLLVDQDNEAARNFYRRLGFEELMVNGSEKRYAMNGLFLRLEPAPKVLMRKYI